MLAKDQSVSVLAVRSLYSELSLYPKPGLVSMNDSGSHSDMTAETFLRSLFSLRSFFKQTASAGRSAQSFQVLKNLGIEAEQKMVRATGGVNTHRGAIFTLGLLTAAVGACLQSELPLKALSLRQKLMELWGADLQAHCQAKFEEVQSHGQAVAQRFQTETAREQAAQGFPMIFEYALPQMRKTLSEGRSFKCAQIDSLFCLIGHLVDTNLYHRGGEAGVKLAQETAKAFLDQGGTGAPDWQEKAERCHTQFTQHRLSPGGAADLLAATTFIHWVEGEEVSAPHLTRHR